MCSKISKKRGASNVILKGKQFMLKNFVVERLQIYFTNLSIHGGKVESNQHDYITTFLMICFCGDLN
jgi:hypothetical protein